MMPTYVMHGRKCPALVERQPGSAVMFRAGMKPIWPGKVRRYVGETLAQA